MTRRNDTSWCDRQVITRVSIAPSNGDGMDGVRPTDASQAGPGLSAALELSTLQSTLQKRAGSMVLNNSNVFRGWLREGGEGGSLQVAFGNAVPQAHA